MIGLGESFAAAATSASSTGVLPSMVWGASRPWNALMVAWASLRAVQRARACCLASAKALPVVAQDVGEVFGLVVGETVGLQLPEEEAVDLVEDLIEAVGGCAEVAEDGVRGAGEGEARRAGRGVVELADVFVEAPGEVGRLAVVTSGSGSLPVVGHVDVPL
ncbi:hypothetical protein [Actinomadura sp. NPDC048394]|uniref:hypothetical protein n=1 Tax=Actinomadura sp. NPDC048394 TaxID=3158223 RepID=UPI0033E24A80